MVSPPTQAEFFEDEGSTERPAKLRPADRNRITRNPASRGGRAAHAVARLLFTLGIGIAGTLGWQSYGDEARQMIADAYPQRLGFLAPRSPAFAAQITPAEPPPPAAPSVDPKQVKGMLLSLAVVNERVDQLATKLDFLQQEMAGEIAELHASEQDILGKISTPPQPTSPARKPAPRILPSQAAPTR